MSVWTTGSSAPASTTAQGVGKATTRLRRPTVAVRAVEQAPKGRSVEKHYRTLSMQDIKSLPVGQLAAKDSVLYLWTTGPFLCEAHAVIEAWGFK